MSRILDSPLLRRLCLGKGFGNQVSRISRRTPRSLALGRMCDILEARKRAHRLRRNGGRHISMSIGGDTRWIAAKSSYLNRGRGLAK